MLGLHLICDTMAFCSQWIVIFDAKLQVLHVGSCVTESLSSARQCRGPTVGISPWWLGIHTPTTLATGFRGTLLATMCLAKLWRRV